MRGGRGHYIFVLYSIALSIALIEYCFLNLEKHEINFNTEKTQIDKPELIGISE